MRESHTRLAAFRDEQPARRKRRPSARRIRTQPEAVTSDACDMTRRKELSPNDGRRSHPRLRLQFSTAIVVSERSQVQADLEGSNDFTRVASVKSLSGARELLATLTLLSGIVLDGELGWERVADLLERAVLPRWRRPPVIAVGSEWSGVKRFAEDNHIEARVVPLGPAPFVEAACGLVVHMSSTFDEREKLIVAYAIRCGLTRRETDVFRIIVMGVAKGHEADFAKMGHNTFRNHLTSILRKTRAKDRSALLRDFLYFRDIAHHLG